MIFRDKLLVLTLLMSGLAPVCWGQSINWAAMQKEITATTDSFFQREHIPGIMVAVRLNGQDFFYSNGYADTGTKNQFDSTTFVEIGSITKTFTAYLLEKIFASKHISDTLPVSSFLPTALQANKQLQKVRVLDLLNHHSGFPRLPENMNAFSMHPYDDYDTTRLFTYLENAHPEPGTYSYSNLGFGIAGTICTELTGKPYAQLISEWITDPLALSDIQTSITTERHATGYFDKDQPAPYWHSGALEGAYILKATPAAMLNYLHHLSFPTAADKEIISLLLKKTADATPGITIGRGWHLLQKAGRPDVCWHNGGTFGFSTFTAFIPNRDVAVFVVVNQFNKNTISDGLGISIIKKMLE